MGPIVFIDAKMNFLPSVFMYMLGFHLGGSESGTDSDGHEKEKAGVVWPRQKKRRNREHQSSCRNEDGREAP